MTKKITKWVLGLLLFFLPLTTNAQQMVTEISWNVYSQNYTGLLILDSDNTGILKIKSYFPQIGWVWIAQDAILTNQFDVYGNCTSYINCYNPVTYPYVPYSADNFVVYPDGSMYTMDSSGTWSTMIVAYVVPQYSWATKFNEYGIEY